MQKQAVLLTALGFFLLFQSCNNDKTQNNRIKDDVSLGLLKEDTGKLARIPVAETPSVGTNLPTSFDLSGKMPEVGNQGEQQSCVAWAIAYAMKGYQEHLQLGEVVKFSPAFVYNQINNGKNAPCLVTDALNILSEKGVCLMAEMPYNENDWRQQPTEAAVASARRFRIDEWRRVNTMDIDEVKTHLAGGLPVIIGATVTTDFIEKGYTRGADYIWKKNGESAGGHAMLLVGYDDAKQAFKLLNSWGKNWGEDGYGWIDYKLFPDVVMYGFVAKDAYTAPEVLADLRSVEQALPLPETTEQSGAATFAKHSDAVDGDVAIGFRHSRVLYNVQNPDKAHTGPSMKIEGTLDIPPHYGKTFYVLVTVYDKETGKPVKTKIYPDYANVDNDVAGYTETFELDEERMKAKWWIHIPYKAFDLKPGRHELYATPTLFVDNFGVKNGEQIEFWFEQPTASQ